MKDALIVEDLEKKDLMGIHNGSGATQSAKMYYRRHFLDEWVKMGWLDLSPSKFIWHPNSCWRFGTTCNQRAFGMSAGVRWEKAGRGVAVCKMSVKLGAVCHPGLTAGA
ncbi:MAG: hypothetical protein Q7J68_04680 [Thermoplasmata archaeon]|nr:hypothetical protein [Thermoplasmata archaeon]